MKSTQKLHDLGQSLWLDNITRDLLNSGTLQRYIDELSVTGLTSNPTIFDHALKNSAPTTLRSARGWRRAKPARALFLIWRWTISSAPPTCSGRFTTVRTAWMDGCRWRCRRCWRMTRPAPSPPPKSFPRGRAAQSIHQNPGHQGGFAGHRGGDLCGVPVNVTLLFSREQYVAAAEAYLRGIERRIAAGLNPQVGSVASMFISRWDVAMADKVPKRWTTGSASPWPAASTRPIVELLSTRAGSARIMPAPGPNVCSGPAPAPRIPQASDILYVKALASAFTVNTMPEATLKALADHGEIGPLMARTVVIAKKFWPSSRRPASTWTALAARFRTKARNRS
jgi:transaldolase